MQRCIFPNNLWNRFLSGTTFAPLCFGLKIPDNMTLHLSVILGQKTSTSVELSAHPITLLNNKITIRAFLFGRPEVAAKGISQAQTSLTAFAATSGRSYFARIIF